MCLTSTVNFVINISISNIVGLIGKPTLQCEHTGQMGCTERKGRALVGALPKQPWRLTDFPVRGNFKS